MSHFETHATGVDDKSSVSSAQTCRSSEVVPQKMECIPESEQVTADSRSPPSLFTLPTEFRLTIYEYAVDDIEPLQSAIDHTGRRFAAFAEVSSRNARSQTVVRNLCATSKRLCRALDTLLKRRHAAVRSHASECRSYPKDALRVP